MKCIKFKEINRNTLIGFAQIEMPSGMIIANCAYHQKNGSAWVSLMRGGEDGRQKYVQIISFRDQAARDKWSAAAVRAIEEFRAS